MDLHFSSRGPSCAEMRAFVDLGELVVVGIGGRAAFVVDRALRWWTVWSWNLGATAGDCCLMGEAAN